MSVVITRHTIIPDADDNARVWPLLEFCGMGIGGTYAKTLIDGIEFRFFYDFVPDGDGGSIPYAIFEYLIDKYKDAGANSDDCYTADVGTLPILRFERTATFCLYHDRDCKQFEIPVFPGMAWWVGDARVYISEVRRLESGIVQFVGLLFMHATDNISSDRFTGLSTEIFCPEYVGIHIGPRWVKLMIPE